MNNYKFNISKLDRLNKKLRQKPYKYIYKEMMPKKLFNKIQNRVYFITQKMVGEDWNELLNEYFTKGIKAEQIKPKKSFENVSEFDHPAARQNRPAAVFVHIFANPVQWSLHEIEIPCPRRLLQRAFLQRQRRC